MAMRLQAPGQVVRIAYADYALCATVLAVEIRASSVRYEVAWVAGSVRHTAWVGEGELANLGPGRMTDRVRNFEAYLPDYFPLPHPSWRSRTWMAKNPWFETDVLPRLRQEVAARLGRSAT